MKSEIYLPKSSSPKHRKFALRERGSLAACFVFLLLQHLEIFSSRFVDTTVGAAAIAAITIFCLRRQRRIASAMNAAFSCFANLITYLESNLRSLDRRKLLALNILFFCFVVAYSYFCMLEAGGLVAVAANALLIFTITLMFSLCSLKVGSLVSLQKRPNLIVHNSDQQHPVPLGRVNKYQVMAARAGFEISKFIRQLFTETFPYQLSYTAFALFFVVFSAAPEGLGATFAGWFQGCLFQANLASERSPDTTASIITSIIAASVLFTSTNVYATRFCAFFQTFLYRRVIHRDSWTDAVIVAADFRTLKIELKERHEHLKNIGLTLIWLATCYGALFWLFGFCNAPLGVAVAGLINDCFLEAGINYDLTNHENLRVFLASVVAGWGVVPLATSAVAFLPAKRRNYLFVNDDGLLLPHQTFPFTVPLRRWRDLKSVSLHNAGSKNECVALRFNDRALLKIPTSELPKNQFHDLLQICDEKAPRCFFDAAAIMRRASLAKSCAQSAGKVKHVSSTIFTIKSPGDTFCGAKYRMVQMLASKPLTATYLARDAQNGFVIVKEFVLPTSAKRSEQVNDEFKREVAALNVMRHHSSAALIETFEENGSNFIVLEHISGADLRTIVQTYGKRSEAIVLRWAKQLASAMLNMHGQNPPLLHRDLTPDNLMEDEAGNIKVIDYGAAHQFVEGVTGTLIGKQCYIAPEQLRGAPSIQSDIYSFGCTLYFLITGLDPVALQQSVVDPHRDQVSFKLRVVIEKCTEFDASLRYKNFEEVIETLESKNDTISGIDRKLYPTLLTRLMLRGSGCNSQLTEVQI